MNRVRAFSMLAIAMSFLMAGRHIALGDSDWLGLCREGTGDNITNPGEQPLQKCANLTDCNISTNTACTSDNSLCKRMVGGMEVDVATAGYDRRSIQVGDCQAPQTTNPDDKCWQCQSPKEMVCHVDYKYKTVELGSCVDRCPKPDGIATASGKCKP